MGTRYQQPQVGARLDPANPIARRIVYASRVAGGCVDIVRNRIPAAVSANRPTDSVSPYGIAGEFVPASSNYYSITTASNLISGSTLTVACWARIDSITAGGCLYSLNGTGYSAILGLLNSAFLLNQTSAASTNVVTALGSDTGWHHIVCVHRSNSYSLYIDGVLRAQTSAGNYWGQPAAGNHSIGNRLNGSSPQYFDGAIQDLYVIQGELTADEAKALFRNHWQVLRKESGSFLLKPGPVSGPTLGVAANTAPLVGSMGFKSQPTFGVNATTGQLVGSMAFGPASRLAVAAFTGQLVGSMGFKSQPTFGVNATTGQLVGNMAFGPSARITINATTAPLVGAMAFAAQPKFGVNATTAPLVGAMAFGPSSRLSVAATLAPLVGAMSFKSQPAFGVNAQTAPLVGSMAFKIAPRFSVAALLAPLVGNMAFLSGQVATVPGELCLTPRAMGRISSNIRKTATISFKVKPL